jgi:hypothetical protein
VVLLANAHHNAYVLALLFLSFFPCIILYVCFANQKFNQLYLQGYQPLKCEDSSLTPTTWRSEDWLKTLYDLWLQGTFINFKEEEIFIFGAWVHAIMRLTTPTLFAN